MALCRKAIFFLAAAIPSLAGAEDAAAQAGALEPYWLSREKQSHIANCVVNIGVAVTFLGKAGVSINAAVLDCNNTEEQNSTNACTAAVGGVIGSFAIAAGFIAASAAECRSSLRVVDVDTVLKEACAASISIIVSMLGIIANSAGVIADTCPRYTGIPEDDILPVERRLSDVAIDKASFYKKLMGARQTFILAGFHGDREDPAPPPPPEGGGGGEEVVANNTRSPAQSAGCAFDVGQFTFLLARAGLMINYAVTDCSAANLREGGNVGKAKCLVDAGRAFGAFGWTASGISYAVFECPHVVDNLNAACAGAIVNLVASTAELVSAFADVTATCEQVGQGEPKEERRLSQGYALTGAEVAGGESSATLNSRAETVHMV